MDRNLTGKKPTFSQKGPRSKPFRVLFLLALIAGGIWLVQEIGSKPGNLIKPLFLPTPTATRTANSYLKEAQAFVNAGKIDDPSETDAIDAYRKALAIDPQNAQAWAELARILTYSSTLLSTQEDRIARMEEARQTIDKALAIQPDDSTIQAIYALVLDWSATFTPDPNQMKTWLIEAEQAAAHAYNLDPNNYLGLAYYAEVLLDRQKYSQAEQYARQAVELAPTVMDTHRVYATVMESFGQYRIAIEEYEKAAEINPNLTFLYIRIGVIYRKLKVYERALEYFNKAISINKTNGIQDPIPYIGIAKTYSRTGEFFIAAINAEKALSLDPTNANTYGQLGIIYTKARNFESAVLVLKCAVHGCSVEETKGILDDLIPGNTIEVVEPVKGLALTNIEVAYYYAQYGSVLAALSRPQQNYCPEAMAVLEQVRSAYPGDPGLMGIVSENEAICLLLKETPSP